MKSKNLRSQQTGCTNSFRGCSHKNEHIYWHTNIKHGNITRKNIYKKKRNLTKLSRNAKSILIKNIFKMEYTIKTLVTEVTNVISLFQSTHFDIIFQSLCV